MYYYLIYKKIINFLANLKEQNFINFVERSGFNTGHALISAGFFEIINKNIGHTITLVWQKKEKIFGENEFRLSTSLLIKSSANFASYDETNYFFNSINFPENKGIEIGLGINAYRNQNFQLDELIDQSQIYLKKLISKKYIIGARGNRTYEFLLKSGFSKESLFISSCPSLQLIKKPPREIHSKPIRILVSGGYLNHSEYLKSLISEGCILMTIPQSKDELELAKRVIRSGIPLTLKLPRNYKEWRRFLEKWKPDFHMGSRMHTAILALSMGIPSVLMSGDLRSQEICEDSGISHASDIIKLEEALMVYGKFNWETFSLRRDFYRGEIWKYL